VCRLLHRQFQLGELQKFYIVVEEVDNHPPKHHGKVDACAQFLMMFVVHLDALDRRLSRPFGIGVRLNVYSASADNVILAI